MQNDLIIVVDMQNVYLEGQDWECLHMKETTNNIVKLCKSGKADVLITAFREPANPVGAWKEYNKQYSDINADDFKNDYIPQIKDIINNSYNVVGILNKSTYSSITEHMKELVDRYDRVLITGVVAECCCIFTAHSVIDLGCKCLWVKDAISGQTVENEEMCEKLLSCHFPLHGEVITTDEYLN